MRPLEMGVRKQDFITNQTNSKIFNKNKLSINRLLLRSHQMKAQHLTLFRVNSSCWKLNFNLNKTSLHHIPPMNQTWPLNIRYFQEIKEKKVQIVCLRLLMKWRRVPMVMKACRNCWRSIKKSTKSRRMKVWGIKVPFFSTIKVERQVWFHTL